MAIIHKLGLAKNMFDVYIDAIDWLSANLERYDQHFACQRPILSDTSQMIDRWNHIFAINERLRPAVDRYIPRIYDLRYCQATHWQCIYSAGEYPTLASGDRNNKCEVLIEVDDELAAVQLALIL